VEQSISSVAGRSAASGSVATHRLSIQPVDPIAFAEEGSAILRAAWRPPCLDYSPEYLRFHCGFPTTLAPVALAAFQGGAPIGFVAATGRRSALGELYLSSFLSVRPGSAPSVSIAMVRQQARALQRSGRPWLVFAQVGSIGDQLLACIDSLGIERVPLGEYRVHSAIPRAAAGDVRVEELAPEAWGVEADRLRDGSLLAPSFDAGTLRHFASDPGGRRFVRARDADGRVVATAMLGHTRSLTATGVDRVPALHCVRLAEQRPEPLAAMLAFAKDAACPVVLVPNAVGIDPPVARAAGVRAAGAVFAAYICPLEQALPPFRGTELEIV
jgi:hypothetical protein